MNNQNVRVWSRRMGHEMTLSQTRQSELLTKYNLREDGRRAGLVVVFADMLVCAGTDPRAAGYAAMVAGTVAHGFIYGDLAGNIRSEIDRLGREGFMTLAREGRCSGDLVIKCVDMVSQAISTRTTDYQKPNITNLILRKVRG